MTQIYTPKSWDMWHINQYSSKEVYMHLDCRGPLKRRNFPCSWIHVHEYPVSLKIKDLLCVGFKILFFPHYMHMCNKYCAHTHTYTHTYTNYRNTHIHAHTHLYEIFTQLRCVSSILSGLLKGSYWCTSQSCVNDYT